MDIINAIRDRRSIRKYLDKEVPEEILIELVEAARFAPSACNSQPWKFKIAGKDDIKKLEEVKAFKQKFVYTASGLVIICNDLEAYNHPQNDYQIEDGTLTLELRDYIAHHMENPAVRTNVSNIDIGIAAGYMTLRAAELGIGACLVKLEKTIRIGKILEIPDKYHIQLTMAVGYAAENPEQRPRKTLQEVLIK